jgi:hypothetical protein
MKNRIAIAAAGIAIVFFVTILIALQFMPQPLKSTDYLVVGAIATFVSMLVLFFLLLQTTGQKGPKRYPENPAPPPD